MFDLSVKGFRGFSNLNRIPVRQITILVGENSSGKTSFLAGLKFCLNFIAGAESPSFNKDPFQLGTYSQIAHSGTATSKIEKSIRFAVSVPLSAVSAPASGGESTGEFSYVIELSDLESRAQVTTVELSDGTNDVSLSAKADKVDIVLHNRASGAKVKNTRELQRGLPSLSAHYWPYILRDLRFHLMYRGSKKDRVFSGSSDKILVSLLERSERLSGRLSSHIFATSAIRTKPLRNYTPGLESEDSEGSHVPHEIAKLVRTKKQSWRQVQDSIVKFGALSEMFADIKVRTFSKSASDPFQIQFKVGSRFDNIVDVGYGNSQVLPILFQIATSRRNDIFLVQQPEVHLHPKAQAALAEHIVNASIERKNRFVLETHSDFVVDRIRSMIFDKKLSKSDVSILFFQRTEQGNQVSVIELDDHGDPVNAPDAYRRFFIDEQSRLLGL